MCDVSIITMFADKAWDGLIKYEEYLLIEKKIINYSSGKITCSLILKKTDKFYKVLYTTLYKSLFNYKITIDSITEVFPETKEISL